MIVLCYSNEAVQIVIFFLLPYHEKVLELSCLTEALTEVFFYTLVCPLQSLKLTVLSEKLLYV